MCCNETLQRDTYPLYSGGHFATLSRHCTYPLYSGGHFATLSRHWWVHVPSVFGGSLCYTVQTLVGARTLCIRGVTLLHCPDTGECTYPLYRGVTLLHCPDTGGCTYPLYSGGHFATLSRHCTYPLYSGGHFATLSRHWWVHVPSVFGGSLCYTVQTLVGARTLCIRGVTLLHCPDTGGSLIVPCNQVVGHFLKVQSPLNFLKLTGCLIRVREVGTN